MFQITNDVHKEMVDHAKQGVPFEIGGYLVGKNGVAVLKILATAIIIR